MVNTSVVGGTVIVAVKDREAMREYRAWLIMKKQERDAERLLTGQVE